MSPTLHAFALEKVFSFLSTFRAAACAPFAVKLGQACKGCNHSTAVNMMAKLFFQSIPPLLDSGMGDDIQKSRENCENLVWSMSRLLGLIRFSSDTLLPHLKELSELVQKFSKLRQKVCVKLSAKIFKACIRSWVDYYPLSINGWEQDVFTDKLGISQAPKTFADLKVTWHIPSEAEVSAANDLTKLLSQSILQIWILPENDTGTLRSLLVLLSGLIKGAVIIGDRQDGMIQDWAGRVMAIAENPKMAIDVRDSALGVKLDGWFLTCVGHKIDL